MKRVLLIMPALYSGGAEKQYRYIIESINDSDLEGHVLLLCKSYHECSNEENRFQKRNKNIHFYHLDGDYLNKNKSDIQVKFEKIRLLLKLRIWINEFLKNKPIDVAMFSYVTELLIVPIFSKKQVKTIFNERNTGRQICDKKFKIKLLRQCTKVISNSAYSSDFITNKTGIKVEVFNNGIQYASIQHHKHEKYTIIVPARINPIKNQKAVVEAFLQILKAGGLESVNKYEVYFAGGIEDAVYASELSRIIDENNLPITILGQVSNIKDYYSTSDLLILPSLEEGTPNVLLEAYMFGILPLVSKIPMNISCCVNEDLLFEPQNALELALKIESAQRNQLIPDIDKLMETASEYVNKEFGLENMKRRYLELFENI